MKRLKQFMALAAFAFAACFGLNAQVQMPETGATANVAKIGDVGYATLAEAVGAVGEGQTITLLADASVTGYKFESPLAITAANVTLDLGGKTLMVGTSSSFQLLGANGVISNGTVTTTGSYALYFSADGIKASNLTLTGGINCAAGTLELTDCNVTANAYGGVYAQGTGVITVKSGTYSSKDRVSYATKSSASCPIYMASGNPDAKIVVEGGTFYGPINAHSGSVELRGGTFYYCNPRTGSSNITSILKIYGGTFDYTANTSPYNVDSPAAMHHSGSSSAFNFVDSDSAVTKVSDGVYTVGPVAQIGETKFKTLAAAIAVVENGQTITMLQDVTDSASLTNNVSTDFTIALGSYGIGKVEVGYETGSTKSEKLTLTGAKGSASLIYVGQDDNSGRAYMLDVSGVVTASGFYLRQNGTVNIHDATITNGYLQTYGAFNLKDSTYVQDGGINVYVSGRPGKNADGKAMLTLDNSTLVHTNGYDGGIEIGGGCGDGSGLFSLANNSSLTAYHLVLHAKADGVTNPVKVEVNNSKIATYDYTYYSAKYGEITMGSGTDFSIIVGANSSITTGTFTNDGGTITVDMSGATADSYTLVDARSTSTYGTYQFAAGKANGYSLKVVDNDLVAMKVVATMTVGETTTSYGSIAEAVTAYNNATTAGAYVIEVVGGEYPLSECEIKQSTTKSLTIRPVKTGDTFATVKLNFNGNDEGAVFKINGGSDYNTLPTVIDHFDFDFGSKASAYGVLMMSQSPNWYASHVTISNCDFVGEHYSSSDSAWTCVAAGCGSKSSPSDITIANCTATKMWSIWNGYLNNNVGGLTVRDCTLSNCSYFVGVTDGSGSVVVDNCDVQLVGAGIRAYAIRLKNGSSSSATVTNSKFALDEGYCAFVGWIGSSGYAPNVKSFYVDDYTAKNITGDSRLADVLNRTTDGLSGTDVKVYLNNSLVATVATTSSSSSGDCNRFFFTAAQIGETKYLTLQEAFNAVTEGQTIEVLRDNTEEITVSKTFAFTIDSNGYTLGSVAPTCATGWKFTKDGNVCSYVEKTKIYVGEGEGKQSFYDTKSAMMAAIGTDGGTTVDFTTFAYEKTTIDTSSEDVSFNTTGTWLLKNGNGALFHYEVQLNSGKSADVAAVMNIEDAHLTAGKVNLYTNAKMTIKDSTVDFEQFKGGSSWFGVKKNSSLEIDNSTVGNKTAGFDAGVATFFGPTFRIYGPMTLKNNSTLYSSVGSSYAAGEALNVCGNGSLSATGSTIYMAALNLGNEFTSGYFLGDASVATSASITLDDAKVYNTQYAGDNIQDRVDGLIVGDGSTHAGVLTLKNGSVFDLTGANANQLKRVTVNANGTITVGDSTFAANNIINNGSISVFGTTKFSAPTYTGTILLGKVGEATTLTTDGLSVNGTMMMVDGSTVTISGSGFASEALGIRDSVSEKNETEHTGYTLILDNADGFNAQNIYVNGGSTFTLKNNSTGVKLYESSGKDGYLNVYGGVANITEGSDIYAPQSFVTGTINVDSTSTLEVAYPNIHVGPEGKQGGVINVNGGTFKATGLTIGQLKGDGAAKYYVDGADQTARLNIKAGSTVQVTGALSNTGVISIDMTDATADSYTLIDASGTVDYGTAGTNYKFAEGKANGYALKVDGTDLVAEKIYVAQIDETKYVTLEDAIKAVDQNGTITIIHDVNETFTAAPKAGVTAFTIVKGSYTLAGKVDAPADYKFVIGDNGCTFQAKDYVVQVGETKYEKLSEALLPLDRTSGETVAITVLKSFSEEIEEPKHGYSFKRDLAFVGADDDTVYTITLENDDIDIDIYGLSFAQNIELDAAGTYFGGDEIVFNGEADIYGVDCEIVRISETGFVRCAEIYVDDEAVLKIASGTLVATDKILVTGKIEIDASKATTTPIKVIEFDYDGKATTDPQYGTVTVIKGYSYVQDKDLYVALNFYEDPTTPGTWHVVNGNGLAEFAASVSAEKTYAGKTIVLDTSVDMTGVAYTPAAGFAGTFDGNEKTISNLTKSLFASIDSATVSDLTISGANINSTSDNIGILTCTVGTSGAVISEVAIVDSTLVTTGERVGGICGSGYAEIYDCEISNCTITGSEQVGGIQGYTPYPIIRRCSVGGTTTITATGTRAGGLVGKFQVSAGEGSGMRYLTDNTVACTVSSPGLVGGLCGQIMGDDGDNDYDQYQIKNNEINVTFAGTPSVKNPIGALRDGQGSEFTSVLAKNITANWWTDATLAANSYTYTNVGTGVDNQTIYRGVAGIDEQNTNFKTLAAALAAVQANQTIEIYADNDEVLTITRTVPFTFKANGHKLGAAPTLPEGYVFVKSGDVCTYGLAVAQVGDNKYLTLKAAADAATSGDTITLLVNYTVASDEVVEIKDGVTFTAGSYTLTNNGTVKVVGTAKFSATSFTGNTIVFGDVNAATTVTTDGLAVTGGGKILDGSTVTLSGNGFNFSSTFVDSVEKYSENGHVGYVLNVKDADLFKTYGFYVNTGSVVNVSNVKALDTTYFNIYGGTMNVSGAGKLQSWSRAGENINVTGAFNINNATTKAATTVVYAGIEGKRAGVFTAEDAIVTSRFVSVGCETRSAGYYANGADTTAAMNLKDSSLLVWNVAGEAASTFKIGSATTYGTLTLDNSTVDFNHNTPPYFCPMNITVGANGTIRMNASSSIAATTMSNAGLIEVDMTGATGASYTLVDADDTSDYGTLGTNYKFAEGKDNRYTLEVVGNDLVANKIFVAQIGEAKYASLAEALKAAESGDVIEILDGTWDAISVGTLTTAEASAVRGKTLTIQPAAGASVTFTANIYIGYDNSTTANAKMTVKNINFVGASLSLVNYNQVDVENCTFNGFGDGSVAGLYIADSCCINHLTSEDYPASQVTIKNCTFDGKNTAGAAIRIRNCGNATISGNTIANVDGNGITFEANNRADNSASKNITVDGNSITEWNVGNKSGGGRAIRFECGTLASGSNVTIEDNVFTKGTLGCDTPDFVKITSAANATVSLEKNGWNNQLSGTVSGNSAYYTVNGETPEIKETKSTKTAIAKVGTALYEDLAVALNAAKPAGKVCELLKNVTLTGSWTPVGTAASSGGVYTDAFKGTFNGNGYTISGLNVSGASQVGLIGFVNGGVVSNLTITGAAVSGTGSQIGVAVGGIFHGTIDNVKVLDSTISGTSGQYIGALTGGSVATVKNCVVTGNTVTGKDQVGGVMGYLASGSIRNCVVDNTVTATEERAGGIAGKANTDSGYFIENNTVSGTAMAPDMAGGVCAQIMGGDANYSIKNNDINVTFGTTPVTNPIGNLRANQATAFTEVLAANITGNWWEDATLAADSYTYTNVGEGVDAQTIYRGVAKIGDKCYKTLDAAIAVANVSEEKKTIVLIADTTISQVNSVVNSMAFDLNGHTLMNMLEGGRALALEEGGIEVEVSNGRIVDGTSGESYGLFDIKADCVSLGFENVDVGIFNNSGACTERYNTSWGAFIKVRGYLTELAFDHVRMASDHYIVESSAGGVSVDACDSTFIIDHSEGCSYGESAKTAAFNIRSLKYNGGEYADAPSSFENVTITCHGGTAAQVRCLDANCDAVVSNCTFTTDGCGKSIAIGVSAEHTVSVTNGTYSGRYAGYVYSSGGTINFTDATLTGTAKVLFANTESQYQPTSANINVYGADSVVNGDMMVSSANTYITLAGGTYDRDPRSQFVEGGNQRIGLATGYGVKENDTTPKTWSVVKYAAKINDTGYETLAEAFAAVENGQTIVAMFDNDETITINPTASYFYFDANGKTLTGTITCPNGYKFVKDDSTGKCTYAAIVAQIVTGTTTNTYQTLQAAVDAATNGDTIQMVANVTCDDSATLCVVSAGKTIVLDLNGKTIASSGSYTKAFDLFQVFGNLTLMDASDAQTGAISLTSSANLSWDYAVNLIWVGNGGALVVNGGNYTVSTPEYGYAEYVICASNNNGDSDLIVNGGTFVGNNVDALIRLHDQENRAGTHLNVTINDGTFTLNGSQCDSVVWLDVQTSGTNTSDCDLTVNGGVFTSNGTSPVFDIGHVGEATGFDVAIKGGSFKGKGQVVKMRELSDEAIAKTVLSGGFYSTNTYEIVRNKTTQGYAALNGLCIENCTITDSGKADYPYGIGEVVSTGEDTTAVVLIETQTATVDTNALAGVVSDPVVATNIAKNVYVSGVKLVATNAQITVSGAQKVITAAKASGTDAFKANLENAANVKIQIDVDVKPELVVTDAGAGVTQYALTPYATVTIGEGGEGKTNKVEVTNDMIDTLQDIVVTVYTGYSPTEGYHTQDDGTLIQTFGADDITYEPVSGTSTVIIHHFSNLLFAEEAKVARIGNTFYTTLEAAFAAAQDEDVIVLLANVTLDKCIAVNKKVTLNIGAYNVTATSALTDGKRALFAVKYGADFTVVGTTGTISSAAVPSIYAAITLTEKGDTYDGTNRAKLTVNANLTGYYYAIVGNGNRPGTDVVVNGGTITAVANQDNLAIFNPQVDSTVTINGGTLTGYSSAIEMRGGTLTVNGGTLTATATEYSCSAAGDGNTTVGAAIAIAQHTTKGDISVTVTGGTFTGVKAFNEADPQGNDPDNVTVAISGGSFTGGVSSEDVKKYISGGTYSEEITKDQCAEWFAPTHDEETGKWGVKEQTAVIADVKALQRYPWNGLVDVTFTFKAKNQVKLFVAAYAKDSKRMTMTAAKLSVDGGAQSDIDCSTGFDGAATSETQPKTYHVIWNSTEAAPNTKMSGVTFKVLAK